LDCEFDNILILSCGTRNKIVQYFKTVLTADNGKRVGRVIAADMSEFAPALYEADAHYIVPRITTDGYIDIVLDICKKERIRGVLSLIDPELGLLAKHQKEFQEIGVTVIGSSYQLCEMSYNKISMYKWLLEHGYKTVRSYSDKKDFYDDLIVGDISYPVFVKPVCGSASNSITKIDTTEMLEVLLNSNEELMIQEYLQGQEIGADVYIDMVSGEIVSIFTKKKLIMRAGETDKAISFKDNRLFDLIERFVKEAGYRGQIDIDLFEINGEYYISEVNPRFGGGYPHAHECGCNHMQCIVNNLRQLSNEKMIGQYRTDICMMKYNEIMIKENNRSCI